LHILSFLSLNRFATIANIDRSRISLSGQLSRICSLDIDMNSYVLGFSSIISDAAN
jgi:hypothetical protein